MIRSGVMYVERDRPVTGTKRAIWITAVSLLLAMSASGCLIEPRPFGAACENTVQCQDGLRCHCVRRSCVVASDVDYLRSCSSPDAAHDDEHHPDGGGDGAAHHNEADGSADHDEVDGAPHHDEVDGAAHHDEADAAPHHDEADAAPHHDEADAATHDEADAAHHDEADAAAHHDGTAV